MEAQSAKSADVRAWAGRRWWLTMVLAGIAGYLVDDGSLSEWRVWAVLLLCVLAGRFGA